MCCRGAARVLGCLHMIHTDNHACSGMHAAFRALRGALNAAAVGLHVGAYTYVLTYGRESEHTALENLVVSMENPDLRIRFPLTWGLTPNSPYLGIRTRTSPHLGIMSPIPRTRGLKRHLMRAGAGINAMGFHGGPCPFPGRTFDRRPQ